MRETHTAGGKDQGGPRHAPISKLDGKTDDNMKSTLWSTKNPTSLQDISSKTLGQLVLDAVERSIDPITGEIQGAIQ